MKILLTIFFLLLCNCSTYSLANEKETSNSEKGLIHGYITNKIYKPINLKVFQIDKDSIYQAEENLEDNSYIPFLDLKVTTEVDSDYSITTDENNIFIPKGTKLAGYISEIQSPKTFDRSGYFKIALNKAICPDGENIYLKSNLSSRSETKVYRPLRHFGKATLGLAGGALAGTLFSYQLGGLGLAVASHGYSLAIGAGAGGFLGTLGGIAAKGNNSKIEPGSKLVILPVDDISLNELSQVTCKSVDISKNEEELSDNVKLEIVSVKEKKDLLGESILKIKIKFTNNSNKPYKLNNFFLKDSQGNEYTTSFSDINSDIFLKFPSNQTTDALIEFLVDHPKASHWLLLKDQNYNEILGMWKVKG